jgi:hypothetical protein
VWWVSTDNELLFAENAYDWAKIIGNVALFGSTITTARGSDQEACQSGDLPNTSGVPTTGSIKIGQLRVNPKSPLRLRHICSLTRLITLSFWIKLLAR